MELYLLRHGEAGKRVPASAMDTERSLTAAGKEEVEEIGEGMSALGLKLDVVASSPLKRAEDTAVMVNRALKRKADVEVWPELSPEGGRDALFRRLQKLKRDSEVLCVGHEPFLTDLVSEIVGGGGRAGGIRMVLRKGGLVRVTVTGFAPRINGELRWLLTPKLMKKLT